VKIAEKNFDVKA